MTPLLVRAFSEEFAIQNGSSVDKFTVQTDTGNTLIEGTLNVNGTTTLTDDLIINVANKEFGNTEWFWCRPVHR